MAMNEKLWKLLHAVARLALVEGESWRVAHPELMDAYEAVLEEATITLKVK